MDPFAVLANRYAASKPGLGHSALPDAPQQPYVERRRWVRHIAVSVGRRVRIPRRRPARSPACPAGTLRGVNPGS